MIPSLAKSFAGRTFKTDPVAKDFRRLSKATELTLQDILALRTRRLVDRRVTNQTRMGKKNHFSALAIAGNRQGLVGLGEASSTSHAQAWTRARLAAIRNMQPIHRYEGRTIYGDLKAKVAGTEVELMNREPGRRINPFLPKVVPLIHRIGFGLRCQDLVYELCRCAGIADLAARVSRARNRMNTAKAAFKALLSQQLPEDVARARGRKLIDVRRVYYAGRL